MVGRALPAPSLRLVRRAAAAGSVATMVLAVAACGSSTSGDNGGGASSSSAGSSLNLTAMDFSFSPNQLSASGGASVTVSVTNSGKVEHSFTLDNGSGTVDIDPGETKTLTFTTPQSGSLQFHCKYHPTRMTGSISVGGAGGAAPSSSSSSSDSGLGY